MALTLNQLKALDTLIQSALDQPEERRAWFNALTFESSEQRTMLERALFPEQAVESETFLSSLPSLSSLDSLAILAAAGARSELQPGAKIGPYTLEKMLGEGGSAAVWRARRNDGTMKRDVALKLPFFVGNTRGWHDRVTRECDILASLQHPSITTIFDAGVEDNGRPWLALELIDGVRIDQYYQQQGLSVERAFLLLLVLRALEHAHARGVIHRDIKPANILVGPDGQPKLLDVGIAKWLDVRGSGLDDAPLTQLHGRPLTPDYASPEQLRGDHVTTASDVYAAGVLLY